MEDWKSIPDYPRYEASSLGRIRSKTQLIKYKDGRSFTRRGKILRTSRRKQHLEYLYVNISQNNRQKKRSVHTLVFSAFVHKVDESQQINHKDGNPADNSLDNLELSSCKENIHHKLYTLGRVPNHKKKRGVWEDKRGKIIRYISEIKYRGKKYNLGHFLIKEDAYEAYRLKFKEFYGREAW